ncbi:hypothetical protein B566_EDAN005425 [Ephemera danica]|nr:hypothetical protein B566_EDAN005425 [Ephemera danica]
MIEELEHLKQGSAHPPLKKDSLRIYIMRFCPFAQRSCLVAEAKQIIYDTINVNLTNKPDWFLALNPRGQVPTLEFEDGDSITESLIVCDYLDEKYSNSRPLHPRDPRQKAKDRLLVERFNDVTSQMFKLYFSLDKPEKDLATFNAIIEKLEVYEKEIKSRGSVFFGGDAAGMLDYMIWPWFERAELLVILGGKELDIFGGTKLPLLKQWCSSMQDDEAVKKWFLEAKFHAHYLQAHLKGHPEYDFLVKTK